MQGLNEVKFKPKAKPTISKIQLFFEKEFRSFIFIFFFASISLDINILSIHKNIFNVMCKENFFPFKVKSLHSWHHFINEWIVSAFSKIISLRDREMNANRKLHWTRNFNKLQINFRQILLFIDKTTTTNILTKYVLCVERDFSFKFDSLKGSRS